ncbi:hypothetical protein LOAG_05920 [Loa loa]|uniref:Uncharacterized protein n=1 Tax=Loa loa TaxID=7209 RepID=A0A1S0TYW1_LOALO|nr:hypothetical protein LOAG_05920 [Loa loa]EFO22570.1 hypothetical protein LOAG_05920 [Loa loa]
MKELLLRYHPLSNVKSIHASSSYKSYNGENFFRIPDIHASSFYKSYNGEKFFRIPDIRISFSCKSYNDGNFSTFRAFMNRPLANRMICRKSCIVTYVVIFRHMLYIVLIINLTIHWINRISDRYDM